MFLNRTTSSHKVAFYLIACMSMYTQAKLFKTFDFFSLWFVRAHQIADGKALNLLHLMSQWQTNSIMGIPKEKCIFALEAKMELCILAACKCYWESWQPLSVFIDMLWEWKNQDKRASLHHIVLSNHAEMPETEKGNVLPKQDMKKHNLRLQNPFHYQTMEDEPEPFFIFFFPG